MKGRKHFKDNDNCKNTLHTVFQTGSDGGSDNSSKDEWLWFYKCISYYGYANLFASKDEKCQWLIRSSNVA